jgi:hypothetical protein
MAWLVEADGSWADTPEATATTRDDNNKQQRMIFSFGSKVGFSRRPFSDFWLPAYRLAFPGP